jgi:lipopolysaccharide export system permease protein
MRILDRQRYWAFFKAYLICFVALIGLYIVIDAFTNLDEFSKRAEGAVELFQVMGRFYLVHTSQFYDRLCGVIGMMAAIFTVTWMQRNNELLAMLAAGISTQRAIRPVWVSTIAVSLLAVFNQEVIMPRYAEEIQKSHDDDGQRKVQVFSRYDSHRILIHGREADRGARTVLQFNATLPVEVLGTMGPCEVQAKQARYIPGDDPRAPLRGGWLLRGARLSPQVEADQLKEIGASWVGLYTLQLSPPVAPDEPPRGEGLLYRLDNLEGFPPPLGEARDLAGEAYFLRTEIKFEAVTRNRQWYQFATTPELIRGLADPANEPERQEIAVFLHGRILRPMSSLTLMLLSLPLVLGGYGRNMFINLGLSLGTSALFYGATFLSKYLGDNVVIPPELSAWAPLIGFGTVAFARWDTIRT